MRHLGGHRAAWATAGLVALAGCTRVSDRSRFEGPEEELEILISAPAPGERNVDPEIRIDLCMSGRIDPRSLDEVDATVSSGGSVFDSELSVQLVPWLAPGEDAPPVDRSAPWCGGSVLSIEPRAPLLAGAQFRLRLFPSAVGWAGEELSTEGPQWITNEGDEEPRYVVEFTIDPTPSLEPFPDSRPTPLTLRDLFTNGRVFDPSTATCSCHREPDHLALARLDLRDPTVAAEGLLGSARPRDTGFAMVAPRDPSQSFLVQKLLREEHDLDHDQGRALYGVLGDPMPPDEPLRYADLLMILQWIADGAEP